MLNATQLSDLFGSEDVKSVVTFYEEARKIGTKPYAHVSFHNSVFAYHTMKKINRHSITFSAEPADSWHQSPLSKKVEIPMNDIVDQLPGQYKTIVVQTVYLCNQI